MRLTTTAAKLLTAACASFLWSCQGTHGRLGMAPEPTGPSVPDPLAPPHSEDVYASTPEQVVAPLRGAIDSALRAPRTSNRSILLDAAHALDETLASAHDVMPLGRVRVLLEDAPSPDEPGLRVVLQTLASTERSYRFNQVVAERPTLFFIHGSDRGPFDTFSAWFQSFAETHNIVFVLYDSFRPTTQKAAWLSNRIREWRARSGASAALHVVAWSDGTTVLRKAVLDDEEGLFRGARIVNLAPPLAGSYRARWVDDGPMRLIAFPALLYLVGNPYLVDMAQDYNPYGELMAEMYGSRTNEVLAEHLRGGSELNVVVEGDPHAPQAPLIGFLEPGYDAYAERYEESLGGNHVRLQAHSENPHQDVTRDPDAIEAAVRHLTAAAATAELQPASTEHEGTRTREAISAEEPLAPEEHATLDRSLPRERRKRPLSAPSTTRRHHGRS